MTEKIWKPIIAQHLFIVHGNYLYLQRLREMGFRTFNNYFEEVYDLDFDYHRKLANIETSKGVSINSIPFGDSYKDYSNLKIFPSPFLIPLYNKMIVDALMYNSSMKIMSLDGLVIRDVNTSGVSADGDQLFWDGKNNNGQYVASGVYLLAITNNSGKNTFSKITVIKK